MRLKVRQLFIVLGLVAFIAGCYPGYDASIEELDLAITKVDENQDFSQLNTFFMYDTVVYIGDEEGIISPQSVDDRFEQFTIDLVRQNMLDLGWTEVSAPDEGEIDADVALMISVLTNDVSYYYYYWWYYWEWWYWDPWYPGFPGYPYYPVYPWVPTYEYTVGTVLIDMISKDAEMAPPDEPPVIRIPVIWSGAANGIVADYYSNGEERLTRQINQVFDQSPYLQK